MLEDRGDDGGRVSEAGDEGAAVDVVEGCGVDPVFFRVVYFEAAIWGNAGDVSGLGEKAQGRTKLVG